MKQFILSIIISLLAAGAGYAQSGKKQRMVAPVFLDEPVRHLVVSGNIDVLLIEDVPSNVGVKLPVSSVDKMDIRVDGDNLYLSASSKLGPEERISAYVTVNDLNSIELKGNVVVTSKGILESQQLKVITNERGLVALRSDGPVTVASPASYQVVKEEKFYTVFAGRL